ncbi:MAG TPA: MFS transporter, partial [Candidatus Melainabacteria bacterium]|nr:MFS transporter [Candidatus Melainabacteria bacterium]
VMFYLIGFIASFAFSQGAVCWVFMAEVFPNQLRNHGQSLGAFTHWTFNFGISLVFPGLVTTLGGGTVFAFFALMMVLQFFYVWKMMPETRGKSLEALQKELVGV